MVYEDLLAGQLANVQITSTRNAQVREVRALGRREGSLARDFIIVEGLRAIIAAIEAQQPISKLFIASDRLRSQRARDAIARAIANGTEPVAVTADILDDLSEREASQGALAIMPRPKLSTDSIPIAGNPLVVVLYEPQDPGNVGTIVRTADGAGAAALAIIGTRGVDPFDRKAVRASMGSHFALPIIELGPLPSAIAALKARNLTLVATSDRGAIDIWNVPMAGPVALIMGNERTGLAEEALAACDAVARIPLFGQADSLNVAAAAAIFIFESVRQRQPR
jgi:tRNA G18 (ribose-2'-O)-methylase SpoU